MTNEKVMKSLFEFAETCFKASKIKIKKRKNDFFASRILIASTASKNLMEFGEKLIKSVDADINYIGHEVFSKFITQAQTENSSGILRWISHNPNLFVMIARNAIALKDDIFSLIDDTDYDINIPDDNDAAEISNKYDIKISIQCLSPLAHGGDEKSGNHTLFRRQNVLTKNNNILSLPFYSGNAFRNQGRDLLADDFLKALDMLPKKTDGKIQLWFFHCLYSGGALAENPGAYKKLNERLGKNGIENVNGIYEFRDMIPMLSVLGTALGNRIISGRINVSDFRPHCKEWGFESNISVRDLFDWSFLTRREDNENHAPGENSAMIANTECLKSGTVLSGGIDISNHATKIETACVWRLIELMTQKGYIGAENRRGLGQVKIETKTIGDSTPYVNFLNENKEKITEYLIQIGAI